MFAWKDQLSEVSVALKSDFEDRLTSVRFACLIRYYSYTSWGGGGRLIHDRMHFWLYNLNLYTLNL